MKDFHHQQYRYLSYPHFQFRSFGDYFQQCFFINEKSSHGQFDVSCGMSKGPAYLVVKFKIMYGMVDLGNEISPMELILWHVKQTLLGKSRVIQLQLDPCYRRLDFKVSARGAVCVISRRRLRAVVLHALC